MESDKKRETRRALLPLLLIVFLDMLGVGIVIPIFASLFFDPAHAIVQGYSEQIKSIMYGFLIALYPLAQFFGAPILGALSDRYGRKKLLLVSVSGSFIGWLLFAIGVLNANLPLMFFARIIDGFTGGSIAIANSAIADISDRKNKVRNFGLMGFMFGIGFILGPFIGGVLSDSSLVSWFSFSLPFFATAGLTLFNIIMIIFLFEETLKYRVKGKFTLFKGVENIQKAFTLVNLRTMLFISFLLTLGFNSYTSFFQLMLIDKFHFTERDIGMFFAFIGLCIAITQGTIVRYTSKRYGPEKILRFSIIGLSIAFLLMVLPSKIGYLYAITAFMAIFQGLTGPNATAVVSNLADKKSQGETLGINQSLQSLGSAIPPIVGGFFVSLHLTLPILIASLLTLISGVMFMKFYHKNKEKFHEI